MADDSNDKFDPKNQMDELINKAKKATFTYVYTSSTADVKVGDELPEQPSEPKQEQPLDFESHAYNNGFDLYGNPVKDKKGQKGKAGGDIKAPERPKSKPGGGGGNNIMDVFWNEFIVPAYTSILTGATDLVLDIVDFALFNAYIPQSNETEKEASQKKTIWDICNGLCQKYEKTATFGKKIFNKAHEELMENIEQAKIGATPSWKIWPGKKEPTFFKEMVELSQKAEADPDSPEAEKWARIKNMPELVERLYNKEVFIRRIAINLATMDVALDTAKLKSPKKINITIGKMEVFNLKASEDDKTNEGAYKERMKAEIEKIKTLITEDNPINKAYNETLQKIEELLQNPQKTLKDKTKSIGKEIENMKNIKFLAQEKEIEERSKPYYESIYQNIEKIKEAYPEDSEKIADTINQYLTSIAEKTKQARPVVDKYIKSSNLGETIRATGNKIKDIANKVFDQEDEIKSPYDPDGHTSHYNTNEQQSSYDPDAGQTSPEDAKNTEEAVKSLKQKAEESLKAAKDTVSEFILDNEAIGSKNQARQKALHPFNNKYGPMSLYNLQRRA